MPIYTLRNKSSDEVFRMVMKVSEYEQFMKDNPDIERYFTSDDCPQFRFVDTMGGKLKCMNGTNGQYMANPEFEENVINRIKNNVHGNKVKDNHKFSN